MLLDLDLSSIPGVCPLTRYGSTIGEILGCRETENASEYAFDPERVEVFKRYVALRIEELLSGRVISDPIKLFIKQEPHKLSKINEDRLRLISAVSIIDTAIDRMLFMDLFSKVVKKPMLTPVAIGWTPLNGGVSYLRSKLSTRTFDTDKKHWDWTFPHWLLRDCYKVLLMNANRPDWWYALAEARFYALFESASFSFPDGSVVTQFGHGIQKSGCYLTLLLNSLGQWLLHAHAERSLGVKVPMVCFGDDVTQQSTSFDQQFVDFYKSLGFKVESASHEYIEFIGFKIFDYKTFVPSYRDKHVFMLSHLTNDEDVAVQTLQSYQFIYWFDKPFLSFVRSIAEHRRLPQAIVLDSVIERVVNGW